MILDVLIGVDISTVSHVNVQQRFVMVPFLHAVLMFDGRVHV